MNEDSDSDIGAFFIKEFVYAVALKEDACGWNGDGTSSFGGIRGVTNLLIDGNHNASKVTAATGHNTFALLDPTDLANLLAAAPAYALPTSKWYVSNKGFALTLCRIAASAGGLGLVELNGQWVNSYLGFPIVYIPSLPQISTTLSGSVMMCFGDLSLAASLGDRREIRARFLTERFAEFDQIGVIGTERFDAVVHDVGDNSVAGPIVGLVAP